VLFRVCALPAGSSSAQATYPASSSAAAEHEGRGGYGCCCQPSVPMQQACLLGWGWGREPLGYGVASSSCPVIAASEDSRPGWSLLRCCSCNCCGCTGVHTSTSCDARLAAVSSVVVLLL
jgi:hypothetical protein